MTIPVVDAEVPRPKDVGVLAMEVYFPRRCISESALEEFDGVSKGKYTIGLGQEYMAWPDDREDINSFALNAVSGLLEKFNIDPKSIGRIDVGTETIIDKSKSAGNFDIEGIDSKNACYVQLMGRRNAIVVCGDIAVYAEGAARPAGGGPRAHPDRPNAPVVFEPIHGTYMANTYDFYKPQLSSEYPEVDGPVSVVTYVAALDAAYTSFREKVTKAAKRAHLNGHTAEKPSETPLSLEDLDYAIFHSPYGKQAVKGHARMMFNDFLANPKHPRFANIPEPEKLLATTPAVSLADKNIEKVFVGASKASFATKTDPGMACSKRLGNMYTASLYGCLASLLSTVEPATLLGKRVSLFSFGSGCASSFWTLKVKGDTTEIREKMNLLERLSQMKVVPPQEFVDALLLREKNHNAVNYTPEGAYYLESVDSKYRRKYLARLWQLNLFLLTFSFHSLN
ncbi:hydroxymethylglutaryl-coenzyme A synthase C terminal-domain-containing protein [Gymnopilus junonius]|uniref:Hydroxymethylglutaryl-CoA synthase n=1 Tax=Gymnopilus junonius TaxID=109634 RepID=A0A9P5NRP4_GYMJU|nr:hydroxymethylglutaryl-coenzyme A synthase C terminal-domain-containing protein [Gymnopilus junonius]